MTSFTSCGRSMYQTMKHKSTIIQEDVMKTKQLVLAALVIFAISGLLQAQSFYPVLKNYSDAAKERLDKAYSISLSFNNNNIIEAALAIVTMMKLDVPSYDFSMIKDKIDDLAANGATPVIRFKAYLAEAVFTNPVMFKEEAIGQYDDPDALFSALAERMTKTLLSSN